MVVKSSYKHACFYGILSFFCLTVIPVGSGKLSQWWVVLVVVVIVVFLSVNKVIELVSVAVVVAGMVAMAVLF